MSTARVSRRSPSGTPTPCGPRTTRSSSETPSEAVLGEWVARGDWSLVDAERVVRLIAGDNARRVYGLDGADT